MFLTKKAVYKTKVYNIDGILFSWWAELENVDSLLTKIRSLIIPITLNIYYTSNILEDCIKNQYDWYLQIIEIEKDRTETLFKDLLGIH